MIEPKRPAEPISSAELFERYRARLFEDETAKAGFEGLVAAGCTPDGLAAKLLACAVAAVPAKTPSQKRVAALPSRMRALADDLDAVLDDRVGPRQVLMQKHLDSGGVIDLAPLTRLSECASALRQGAWSIEGLLLNIPEERVKRRGFGAEAGLGVEQEARLVAYVARKTRQRPWARLAKLLAVVYTIAGHGSRALTAKTLKARVQRFEESGRTPRIVEFAVTLEDLTKLA